MPNAAIKTHIVPCVASESETGDGRDSIECSLQAVSNSSVFNVRAKVLKSLRDLQLNEREF